MLASFITRAYLASCARGCRCQFFRRRAARRQALRVQLLAHVGVGQRLLHLGATARRSRLGVPAGAMQREPRVELEAGQARLRNRRHVGELRHARGVVTPTSRSLPALTSEVTVAMPWKAASHLACRPRPSRPASRPCRARASSCTPGLRGEQGHRDVLRAAVAARAVVDLAGRRLAPRRSGRRRSCCGASVLTTRPHSTVATSDTGSKSLRMSQGIFGLQVRHHGHDAVVEAAEGVAVGRRLGHVAGADQAGRAGLVLDDDRSGPGSATSSARRCGGRCRRRCRRRAAR